MYIGPAQMGLFHECFPTDVGTLVGIQVTAMSNTVSIKMNTYWNLSGASFPFSDFFFIGMLLVLVGMFLLLLGIFLFISGLLVYSLIPKRRLYNATVGLFILAALLYTACLVILPVFFLIQFSDDKFQAVGHSHGNGEIAPGFALFIGVAGVLVLIISTILLIIDKRVDEIIYREKINQ
ncbi:unnamed protein product [Hymenolepis diminuta]|uniref:DUF996 domain-containing protein n=1 Tax=Hymenolepis diminuta TaxID=6216 RepID=A0A158QDC1_HYMDI|nr:unnamed protein product [Hymenolepis diminuta]